MNDSFLPSDDDSDEDDEELYEHLEKEEIERATHAGSEATVTTGSSGNNVVGTPPPAPRPAPIRPKVQRRLSLRVPSLPKNTTLDDDKTTTLSKEQLDELLQILKTFPLPPTVSHDSQQTTTNMIYNNKITDTAVKLVSGIGKFSKFLASSSSSSSSSTSSTQQRRTETTPSPMHPSYSSQDINTERL